MNVCVGRFGGKTGNNSINQAEQIGFCDSLNSSHNSIVCLANLQAASGNRSICGRIRGYEAMHACQNLVAYATGDLSACGGPNSYYYEQCIMNMAVIKKNVSLCLMLDTGGPEIAYSWCFDHYARELKDPTVCGMLKKEENRDSCRKNAAGT